MSNLPSRADACALLGCADRELVDIFESEQGPIFKMSDGNSLINVNEKTPDHEGKTGLMFLYAPNVGDGRTYQGDFPVFIATPVTAEEAEEVGDVVEDLSKLTKAQLIAHGLAQVPPVVLDDKTNKTEMLTALADAAALAASDAEKAGNDE